MKIGEYTDTSVIYTFRFDPDLGIRKQLLEEYRLNIIVVYYK